MKYPIIFFLGVMMIVTCLVLMFTNFNNAGYQLSAVMASESIDECFDQTMDTWFKEFNANQELGNNVYQADQLAAAKALDSFDDCH